MLIWILKLRIDIGPANLGQSFWRKDGRKIPHGGPGVGTSGPWEPPGRFRLRTVSTAPDIQEDCTAGFQSFRKIPLLSLLAPLIHFSPGQD